MIYNSELANLTGMLSRARREKRLSQSALSARLGMPQSHLSKIEKGVVDLRATNLIDLARALDLEVVLVPQSLLPAVKAMTRGATLGADTEANDDNYRETERGRRTKQSLRDFARDLERAPRRLGEGLELARLIESINLLSRIELSDERATQIGALLERLSPAKVISVVGVEPWLKQHGGEIAALRNIRNELVHGAGAPPLRARPAYRLSDGDDDA